MHRTLSALGLLLFALVLPACAVPRMLVMATVVKSEIPCLPGSTTTKVGAVGWVTGPYVAVHLDSPLTLEETLAWYRKKLPEDHWLLDQQTWDIKPEQIPDHCQTASRNSFFIGTRPLASETISIILRRHQKQTTAEIIINVSYLWDAPVKALAQGYEDTVDKYTFEPVATFVEHIGGDEITLAIVSLPLTAPYYLLVALF